MISMFQSPFHSMVETRIASGDVASSPLPWPSRRDTSGTWMRVPSRIVSSSVVLLLFVMSTTSSISQWRIISPNTYGWKTACLQPLDRGRCLLGGRGLGILRYENSAFTHVRQWAEDDGRYYLADMAMRGRTAVTVSDRNRRVFFSHDDGASWTRTIARTSTADTAFGFLNSVYLGTGGRIWVAGNEEQDTIVDPRFMNSYYRGVILFSSDYGKTWSHQMNRPIEGVRAIAFADDSTGYAIKEFSSSMAKTTNGGDTWEDILTSVYDPSSVACLSADTVFTITHQIAKGLFRSVDGGFSWTRFLPFDICGVYSSIDIRSVGTMSVIACTNGLCVYTSTSRGTDWSIDTIPKLRRLTSYFDLSSRGIRKIRIQSDSSQSPFVIWVVDGDGDVYTLDVRTHTWQHINPYSSDISGACTIGSTALFSTDSVCYIASDPLRSPTGMLSPVDGFHRYTSPVSVGSGTVFMLGYDTQDSSRLLTSRNGGLDWTVNRYACESSLSRIRFLSDSIGFGWSGSSTRVHRTHDGGRRWTATIGASTGVTAVTFVGDSIVIGVGYDGGTVRSRDMGRTWDYVQTADTSSFRAAWTTKDGSVFVGDENGSVQRSDDSGRTWFKLSTPLPRWSVKSIAFVDRLRGAAIIGDPGSSLYQTTDGGETWTEPSFKEIEDTRVPAYLEDLMVTGNGSIIGYGQRGIIVSWNPEAASTGADDVCTTCTPRFIVAPVPADDFLVIRPRSDTSAPESVPLTVHVYDALGALVMQRSMDDQSATRLDLTCLASGAYHLVVRDVNMQTFRTTFIVAR